MFAQNLVEGELGQTVTIIHNAKGDNIMLPKDKAFNKYTDCISKSQGKLFIYHLNLDFPIHDLNEGPYKYSIHQNT